MAGIRYVVGDATRPQGPGPVALAHIVNDLGRWGKGFVVPLGKRYPAARNAYLDAFRTLQRDGRLPLGMVVPATVAPGLVVMNMVAQSGIGRDKHGGAPIRYDALRECLRKIVRQCVERGEPGRPWSVHGPRFGSGLAGGDWDVIECILKEEVVGAGLDVIIYDLA